MTEHRKCSHDLCKNEVNTDSTYCNSCIQLPTRECNFCNVEHQRSFLSCGDTTGSLLLDILVELFVCFPLSALITSGILACYWMGSFISQSVTGQSPPMISGDNFLMIWFTTYLLLFLWVRLGSTKMKWSF